MILKKLRQIYPVRSCPRMTSATLLVVLLALFSLKAHAQSCTIVSGSNGLTADCGGEIYSIANLAGATTAFVPSYSFGFTVPGTSPTRIWSVDTRMPRR